MNWRSEREEPVVPADYLAQRILNGLAQSGVHRALVDLENWTLLKWLDEPAVFFDWRTRDSRGPLVHPDDALHLDRMTEEFATAATSAVLRLRTSDGGWIPVHITVNRIELETDTFAGLVSLRLPTDEELVAAAVGEPVGDRLTPARRPKPRNAKAIRR